VEGQLQSRTYQAKDGTNRYVVEVVADNVSFTGERRENSGQSSYGQSYSQPYSQVYNEPVPQQPAPSYQSGSVDSFQEMPVDDDLPF
ncbi:MAG: single-stranded DNA-binding protein, partial [Ruminococcus sp.]|nr:single-stranded DNA-binding protein [Ruminococcus sp.]